MIEIYRSGVKTFYISLLMFGCGLSGMSIGVKAFYSGIHFT